MSINRVNISGNLTRDPELRATPSGSAVLNFGMAVNDRRRNASGDWEDVPNFVDCVVFGARAEGLAKVLSKGMKIALEGKLRYSSWEKDGQKRSKLEVVAEDVEFFSQRQQEADRSPQPQGPDNYIGQYNAGPQNAPQQPYGTPQYYGRPY